MTLKPYDFERVTLSSRASWWRPGSASSAREWEERLPSACWARPTWHADLPLDPQWQSPHSDVSTWWRTQNYVNIDIPWDQAWDGLRGRRFPESYAVLKWARLSGRGFLPAKYADPYSPLAKCITNDSGKMEKLLSMQKCLDFPTVQFPSFYLINFFSKKWEALLLEWLIVGAIHKLRYAPRGEGGFGGA